MTKAFSGTHRILTLALLCSVLFVGVLAFAASPAHAASNTPTQYHKPTASRHIALPNTPPPSPPANDTYQCGGSRWNPLQWTISQSGGYGGGSCNGKFSYILTPTSNWTDWDLGTYAWGVQQSPEYVWVYVPSPTGAVASYVVTCGSQYMFTQVINQNLNRPSPWVYIGQGTPQPPYKSVCQMRIRMSSSESTHWYLGEDAIAYGTTE